MPITKVIPVFGTSGFCNIDTPLPHPDHWYEAGHPFVQFLASNGIILYDPEVPFEWTGDLDGHFGWLPWNWFGSKDHRDWKAGGRALRYYLAGIPLKDRNIIAHSHGLQVVLYAVGGAKMTDKPCPVNKLVTVGSPVRADMEAQVRKARPHISYWEHLFDPTDVDRMQIAGEFGDGRIGTQRHISMADRNTKCEYCGHSDVLRDEQKYSKWIELGTIDRLR